MSLRPTPLPKDARRSDKSMWSNADSVGLFLKVNVNNMIYDLRNLCGWRLPPCTDGADASSLWVGKVDSMPAFSGSDDHCLANKRVSEAMISCICLKM